eukprot:ANDGO_07718.mRNA.1 hypothetical protein
MEEEEGTPERVKYLTPENVGAFLECHETLDVEDVAVTLEEEGVQDDMYVFGEEDFQYCEAGTEGSSLLNVSSETPMLTGHQQDLMILAVPDVPRHCEDRSPQSILGMEGLTVCDLSTRVNDLVTVLVWEAQSVAEVMARGSALGLPGPILVRSIRLLRALAMVTSAPINSLPVSQSGHS